MDYKKVNKYFTKCKDIDLRTFNKEDFSRSTIYDSNIVVNGDTSLLFDAGLKVDEFGKVCEFRVKVDKVSVVMGSFLARAAEAVVGTEMYLLNPEEVLVDVMNEFRVQEGEVKEVDSLRYVLHNLVW